MKFTHYGLASLLIPTVLAAQAHPRSTLLDWGTVHVVLAPDTARGTILWADTPEIPHDSSTHRSFTSYLNRTVTEAWIRESRAFLAQPPTGDDTSSFRSSTMLVTNCGEVFLLYRRERGKWSSQRFIAFQRTSGEMALIVSTSEGAVLDFLSALESVIQETPLHAGAVVGDSIPIEGTVPRATGVRQKPGTNFVRYPVAERNAGIGGRAWVSFVVLPSGKADMSTYQVLFADTPGFDAAVREGLSQTQFIPSTLDGRPIAIRVFQPFTFSIVR
jgi:TonB family protein